MRNWEKSQKPVSTGAALSDYLHMALTVYYCINQPATCSVSSYCSWLQLTSNTQCLTSLWQVANLQDLASELFEPPSHGSLLSWQLMTFYGSFLPGEILKFGPSISTCFYQEKERTTVAHPSSDWLTYPYHHFLKETWKIIISTFLYQIK